MITIRTLCSGETEYSCDKSLVQISYDQTELSYDSLHWLWSYSHQEGLPCFSTDNSLKSSKPAQAQAVIMHIRPSHMAAEAIAWS